MDRELPQLAELGLRFGVDLIAERIDRVFLNRATEHVLARRLIRELQPKGPLKRMLTDIAREDWISGPYGLSPREEDDESGTEAAQFDERGVHSLYEERAEANAADIDRVAHRLAERRKGAAGKVPVLDVYGRGPNLWLGDDPVQQWRQSQKHRESPVGKTLQAMHGHIFTLMSSDEAFWESRRMAFQAIRRAVLRESVLLRLLPDKKERDEASWGELIVKAFFTPLPRQREGMADRISVFLEDLMAASGSLSDPSSARFALYDATRLRDQQFVALVSGDSDQRSRERVFSGFNTPLLPEVLICTSIGQEGIDLHRHCRHVVHFDLAWNPAVLEQRTGRADRIGSKTFRERAFSRGHRDSFLDIGVPYLAGTYDERMYEELRLRAQTFEVLTGGDLIADDAAGVDNQKRSEGQEAGLRLVPLPDDMVDEMRVNLHVWTEDK